MKKSSLFWITVLASVIMLSSCEESKSYIFHGACDPNTFTSYCEKNHSFTCPKHEGLVLETVCEEAMPWASKCVEDDFGASCSSKDPSQRPNDGYCLHNPDGDGKDYEVSAFQNPDNDNYWEVRRILLTDAICYEDMVIRPGDEGEFYSLSEGIMGCNLNTLFYKVPVFTGKKSGLKEYKFYTKPCKDNQRCDEVAGCIEQCTTEGEIKQAIRWPNSLTSVDVECQKITDKTSNTVNYYYVSPLYSHYEKIDYSSYINSAYIYHGLERFDNPNGYVCDETYVSQCIGNVAANCIDGKVQAIDCRTGLCMTDYPTDDYDETLKENFEQHRAWCSPLCQKEEIGKKIDSCYFLANQLIGYENISTTFECTDKYSKDNTPSYIPMSVKACANSCNLDTGKCSE